MNYQIAKKLKKGQIVKEKNTAKFLTILTTDKFKYHGRDYIILDTEDELHNFKRLTHLDVV